MIIMGDDFKSLFHFILGFITPLLGDIGLMVIGFYALYQAIEPEDLSHKIGDIFEFLAGVGGCYIVLMVAGMN